MLALNALRANKMGSMAPEDSRSKKRLESAKNGYKRNYDNNALSRYLGMLLQALLHFDPKRGIIKPT